MFDIESERNFQKSEDHFLNPDYKFSWESQQYSNRFFQDEEEDNEDGQDDIKCRGIERS